MKHSDDRILLQPPVQLEIESLCLMASPLIHWFSQYARRLPWRVIDENKRPAPYQVWISEIMLQQTRVEAVKSYYVRFMEVLPTVKALAEVSQDVLLKLWEGLGYYSRARNLQKAARMVMEQYGGELPSSYKQLLSLPGVGAYTAGAVASIAFRQPVPAVDGNVLRVISRILDSRLDITKPQTKEAVDQALWQVFSSAEQAAQRPDLFNQALMELGATVCIPNGTPQCLCCPVNRYCLGYARGTAPELPVKEPKKPRRTENRTVALLRWNGRAALKKRPSKGLLAGLWELPNLEGVLTAGELAQQLGIPADSVSAVRPLGKASHIFTHIQWQMTGWELILISDTPPGPDSWIWLTPREIREEYSIPSALKAYSSKI